MTHDPNQCKEMALEIITRLREKGLDQLTVQDVLEALQQDGIQDLEQLVNRQLELTKGSHEQPRVANHFSSPTYSPPSMTKNIVHKPPQIPIMIDGKLHDPKDINRFDGQPLHFVAPTSDGQPLQAFSGDQWPRSLHTYLQVRKMLAIFDVSPQDFGPYEPSPMPPIPPYPAPPWWPSPTSPGWPSPPQWPPIIPFPSSPGAPSMPAPPPPPPDSAQFFSDSNYGGDWLWLGPVLEWPDLTKVSRGTVLFWSGDWNDVISSVKAWNGLVVLCEHINLGGSSYSIPSGAWVDDLTRDGWNDRTSSIVNWG